MYSKWRKYIYISIYYTLHKKGRWKMVTVWTGSRYVEGYGTIRVTAQDANNDINPQNVSDACKNVQEVAEQSFKKIGSRIIDVECGKDALSAEDASMEPVLEENGNAIKGLASQMSEALEQVVTQATEAHDKLQEQYNEEAQTMLNSRVASAQAEVAARNNE